MKDRKRVFAELADSRARALKRYAFLLCGDDNQAEDMVQEALVRAFSRRLPDTSPGGIEAYVRTIIVNLFIDATRRRARWTQVVPMLARPEPAADPAERIASRDAMLTALAKLSPRQRACIVLRYYDDLPVSEVASALGIAEGTAKWHLSEATSRLAVLLESSRHDGQEAVG